MVQAKHLPLLFSRYEPDLIFLSESFCTVSLGQWKALVDFSYSQFVN